ncbi:UDP-N-acetylmuramoyl-tripeptide--D-alanyl-D-alanine ligase [Candidatus Xenohaliotis californiensis]|uniref:UDP-N-acetylmuramoyl-tripeptide--D-alanyl-D-alanine ligase n=1 Tax=Candidatus Xenohaliotis californiensis TaxID=84677 RepID=A0ABM9N9K6_9RICK|nr:UDP-N-acetylmuramoyl-tripeptide--D-alanyl-D-alanine ligase [Candidatus Xenohaliotis californiensis]
MRNNNLIFTIATDNPIFNDSTLFNIKKNINFSGISIDSRTIQSNEIFIALKGSNFNGSDYAQQAIENGASAVIIDKKNPEITTPMIVTNNCFTMLQNFAQYHRQLNKGKFIAVTGSFGKTTTKNMLKESLAASNIKVYATKDNLNNHIGLPLTIANNPLDTKYSVIETAMSSAGEIDSKSKLVKPDIAIITGVGITHGENFKTADDIACTKAEVFNHLSEEGIAIIGEFGYSIKKTIEIAKLHPKVKKLITYGFAMHNDIQIISLKPVDINNMLVRVRLFNKEISYQTATLNESIAMNSLALLAVAEAQNLNLEPILFAIHKFQPTIGRGTLFIKKLPNGIANIIDESYNTGPESIVNGIKTLCNMAAVKKGRKILVISNLSEFGQFESTAYSMIGEYINNVDLVYLVGKKFKKYIPKNIVHKIFNNAEDMANGLANIIQNNDNILIKGARIMQLDKAIDILLNPS